MGWMLYALLKKESPLMTRESLKKDVEKWLANNRDVVISDGYMPFNLPPSIHLAWKDEAVNRKWGISIHYDEGEKVKVGAKELARRAKSTAPEGMEELDRQVRVGFGDDPDSHFVDEAMNIVEFVATIPHIVLYDDAQKKVVDALLQPIKQPRKPRRAPSK